MTQKRRSNTVHLTAEIARRKWAEKLGGPKIKKDPKR